MLNTLSTGLKRVLTIRKKVTLTENPLHETASPSAIHYAPTPVQEQVTPADAMRQSETPPQPHAQAPVKKEVPASDTTRHLETLTKEIKFYQKSYKTRELDKFGNDVLRNPWLVQLLRDAGREKVRNKDYDGARQLLGAALQLNPDDAEATFQYAVASSRTGRNAEAIEKFRSLKTSGARQARTLSEYAQALRRAIEQSGHSQSEGLVRELREVVEARVNISEVKEGILPPSIAATLSRVGHVELAERALAQTMEARPNQLDALITQARILTETGRVDAGLDIAREILVRNPSNETALQMLRTFRDMSGSRDKGITFALLQLNANSPSLFTASGTELTQLKSNAKAIHDLERSGANWIAVSNAPGPAINEDWRMRIVRAGSAGCLKLSPDLYLWKVTALCDVLEADLAKIETLWTDLERLSRFYVRPAPKRKRGNSVLISRYGKEKFGGAEHFLHSAAVHYKNIGYSPLIVGSTDKRPTTWNEGVEENELGLRFGYVDMKAAALRRLIVEQDVTLIHAISGMGFLTAAALGDMNVPFIYGVHYFREVLGGGDGDVFFDVNEKPIPRADFGYLLSRASKVYTNSAYTQNLIESVHGVRCPVIFSVPEERS